jgi:rubrerythrin
MKPFKEAALPFESLIERDIRRFRAEETWLPEPRLGKSIDKPYWEFCSGIDALIDDEVKATEEYEIIARKLSGHDMKVAVVLESIALDENKHARMFRVLKALVC